MYSAMQSHHPDNSQLLRAVALGGGVAGALDLISAFVFYGPGVPRVIAGGLLGPASATDGRVLTWILGVVLQFFIATSAAAIYCTASRRLNFLVDSWLSCGLFYGIAVFLVMNLVVLPLSAYHDTGPYTYHNLVQGILIHMFFIGLPISFSLYKVVG